jgi:hypothetical protein
MIVYPWYQHAATLTHRRRWRHSRPTPGCQWRTETWQWITERRKRGGSFSPRSLVELRRLCSSGRPSTRRRRRRDARDGVGGDVVAKRGTRNGTRKGARNGVRNGVSAEGAVVATGIDACKAAFWKEALSCQDNRAGKGEAATYPFPYYVGARRPGLLRTRFCPPVPTRGKPCRSHL